MGKHCHIGAGTVLAGVIEPASATPVIIEDDVFIGANAVVIEGVRVGQGAVVAAGSVVIADVPANAVVAGVPAKVIKMKDGTTSGKTELLDALRTSEPWRSVSIPTWWPHPGAPSGSLQGLPLRPRAASL